ncbi:MAG: T9SS type A sorting domain-containing protein, partial [Bacteroidota bacterium]
FDITVGENDTYTFNESEFSFNDQDGEDLVEIEITTLPGLGALEVGGLPIPAGATVAAGDLGTMTFSPFANEFGTPYTSFEFRVSDGIQFSINTYTVTINVDENTATVELLDAQAVAISPNPTQDGLLVEANLDTPAEEGTIRILNTLGQEVRAFPLDKGLSKVQQWIDLNGLTNGTYFLELEADQAFWTGRFQKQ